MSYFGATEFDEAIVIPKLRIKAQDPEIKNGRVEVTVTQTKAGPLEQPYHMQGGFAVVYKFKKANGKQVALRCLMKDIAVDMKDRYEKIGRYLKKHAKEISADFTFYEQGIKVKNNSGEKVFPIIDMEWVEGLNLDQKIDELCKKSDKTGLGKLLDAWCVMIGKMKLAKIAHSDLAGGNIKVRPNGDLVLIDYDGMYIPDLAGRDALTYGQAPFQHPVMKRPYDEYMDEFSIIVVYTALLALQENPSLWKNYAKYDAKGNFVSEGILFEKTDFENPSTSTIFNSIKNIQHKELQEAIKALEKACGQRPEQVRVPPWMVDPDLDKKDALAKLLQAISSDNDDAIVAAWVDILGSYAPAQTYLTKVEASRKRVTKLKEFRQLLSKTKKDDDAIFQAYDQIIEPKLSRDEKSEFEKVKKRSKAYNEFAKALAEKDDNKIVVVWKKYAAELENYYKVTLDQKNAKKIAEDCVTMDIELKNALITKDDEKIAQVFKENLKRPWMNISDGQRDRIKRAQSRAPLLRNFRDAITSKNHQKIHSAYQQLENDDLQETNLSGPERDEFDLAKKRAKALEKFKLALEKNGKPPGGFEDLVVNKYDHILDNSNLISISQRTAYDKAKYCVEMPNRVREAINTDDDEQIDKAYESALERAFMHFDPKHRERIKLAKERLPKYRKFIKALESKNDEDIVKTYDETLAKYSKISSEQKDQYSKAKARCEDWQKLRKAIDNKDDLRICEIANKLPSDYYRIDEKSQSAIRGAKERYEAYQKLTSAITKQDDDEIIRFANLGARKYSELTSADKGSIESAENRKKQYDKFVKALDSGDDEEIKNSYTSVVDRHPKLSPANRTSAKESIERCNILSKFREAYKKGKNFEHEWVKVYDENPWLKLYSKIKEEEREVVDKGRLCIEMPMKVRQAINDDDDLAIAKNYSDEFVRNYTQFNNSENERIKLAIERTNALKSLKEAIIKDKDEAIVNAYVKSLEEYKNVTPKELKRVNQAKDRQNALNRFRRALAKPMDEKQVVASYDKNLLDNYDEVSKDERSILDIARRCVDMPALVKNAIDNKDDKAIVQAFSDEFVRAFTFQNHEEEKEIRLRVQIAKERIKALDELAKVLETDEKLEHDEAIVEIYYQYKSILDTPNSITSEQSNRVKRACNRVDAVKRFKEVINTQNEKGIVFQYDKDRDYLDRLDDSLRSKLQQAQECVEMPAKIKSAIANNSDIEIAQAYLPTRERGFMDAELTPMRARIKLAQERVESLKAFSSAIETNDDKKIIESYKRNLDECKDVKSEQKDRLSLAQKRQEALNKFVEARNEDDEKLFNTYNPILDNYDGVPKDLQNRYSDAKSSEDLIRRMREAVLEDDDEKISKLYDASLERYIGFTKDLELTKRVTRARNRMSALQEMKTALEKGDEREINRVYEKNKSLLDGWTKVTPIDSEQIQKAQDCIKMQKAVREGLATNDDKKIKEAYKKDLERPWMGFIGDDQRLIREAINRVSTLERVQQALNAGRISDAIAYERQSGVMLNDANLNNAKKNYIANLIPQNIRAKINQGLLQVDWDWNTDPAVEAVVIVWSPKTFPVSPEPISIGSDSTRIEIKRDRQITHGKFERKINDKMVYVSLFSALRYTDASHIEQWYYSTINNDSDTMVIARETVIINCKLKYPLGSPQNELILNTKDGSPLPNLVICAKSNDLPQSPKDGTLVCKLDQLSKQTKSEVKVMLNLNSLPENACLRVFGADLNDRDRVTPEPMKIKLYKVTL